MIAISKGDWAEAKAWTEREMQLRCSIGEKPGPMLASLGYISIGLGELDAAQAFLEQARLRSLIVVDDGLRRLGALVGIGLVCLGAWWVRRRRSKRGREHNRVHRRPALFTKTMGRS